MIREHLFELSATTHMVIPTDIHFRPVVHIHHRNVYLLRRARGISCSVHLLRDGHGDVVGGTTGSESTHPRHLIVRRKARGGGDLRAVEIREVATEATIGLVLVTASNNLDTCVQDLRKTTLKSDTSNGKRADER